MGAARQPTRRYSFEEHHVETKRAGTASVDPCMYGLTPIFLLYRYGDLHAARAGWTKNIACWRLLEAAIAEGRR